MYTRRAEKHIFLLFSLKLKHISCVFYMEQHKKQQKNVFSALHVLYTKKNKDEDENQESILDQVVQILLGDEQDEGDSVEDRELPDIESDDEEDESDYLEEYDISNEDMCDTIQKVRNLDIFSKNHHSETKSFKNMCKKNWRKLLNYC